MSDEALRGYRELAGEAVAERGERGLGWWGMALFVATEAALFAALVASYFYLRWYTDGGWPPSGEDPEVLRPAAFTLALVLSSGAMAAAQVAARRGSARALPVALAVVLALGLVFVGLQAWDVVEKTELFTPQTDAYSSLVYTLSGAHAIHVLAGVAIVAWVLARALAGAYGPQRHTGVAVAALYWHFVVVLAVVVFLVLVISPRL